MTVEYSANEYAGKTKKEYIQVRRRLKIIDTISAGIAIINGLIAYIEVFIHL